jgi:YD repeat-containing protein
MDRQGREAIDGSGRAATSTYDASGGQSTVTDAAGGLTQTYDSQHRMLASETAEHRLPHQRPVGVA